MYNMPKQWEGKIEEAIRKLLSEGYIRKSESTWVNNIRPVLKLDGSIRITTNLVALNKIVELDGYSLPNIDEMLCNLKNMEYFTKLNMKDGFFQIPLAEKDRHKTTFRYKHRLYE